MDDDFFFGAPVEPSDWFRDGKPVVYFEKWAVRGGVTEYEQVKLARKGIFDAKILHSAGLITTLFPRAASSGAVLHYVKHAPFVFSKQVLCGPVSRSQRGLGVCGFGYLVAVCQRGVSPNRGAGVCRCWRRWHERGSRSTTSRPTTDSVTTTTSTCRSCITCTARCGTTAGQGHTLRRDTLNPYDIARQCCS